MLETRHKKERVQEDVNWQEDCVCHMKVRYPRQGYKVKDIRTTNTKMEY